jgi:hypothetical protein
MKLNQSDVYGALQSLRHLGLEPAYYDLEGLARAIKKNKSTTLEQVRLLSVDHPARNRTPAKDH